MEKSTLLTTHETGDPLDMDDAFQLDVKAGPATENLRTCATIISQMVQCSTCLSSGLKATVIQKRDTLLSTSTKILFDVSVHNINI